MTSHRYVSLQDMAFGKIDPETWELVSVLSRVGSSSKCEHWMEEINDCGFTGIDRGLYLRRVRLLTMSSETHRTCPETERRQGWPVSNWLDSCKAPAATLHSSTETPAKRAVPQLRPDITPPRAGMVVIALKHRSALLPLLSAQMEPSQFSRAF